MQIAPNSPCIASFDTICMTNNNKQVKSRGHHRKKPLQYLDSLDAIVSRGIFGAKFLEPVGRAWSGAYAGRRGRLCT